MCAVFAALDGVWATWEEGEVDGAWLWLACDKLFSKLCKLLASTPGGSSDTVGLADDELVWL